MKAHEEEEGAMKRRWGEGGEHKEEGVRGGTCGKREGA